MYRPITKELLLGNYFKLNFFLTIFSLLQNFLISLNYLFSPQNLQLTKKKNYTIQRNRIKVIIIFSSLIQRGILSSRQAYRVRVFPQERSNSLSYLCKISSQKRSQTGRARDVVRGSFRVRCT